MLSHVFLLPFSMVCRPLSPPSRIAWLFCRDPWISHVAPRVSLTFLRGLSSSLSPFSNCLAILPGSVSLTCCPTCFCYLSPWSVVLCYLSPWSVVLLISLLELLAILPGSMDLMCFPMCFSYLSPWSVVLLLSRLKLPGYFARILGPHELPHVFKVTFLHGLSSSLSPFSNYLAILPGSLDLTCCPMCFCYLSLWSVVFLISLLELPGNFAGIFGLHVLCHVFLLPFSVVCRPPYLPSRTAWQFCRDPWTSHVSSLPESRLLSSPSPPACETFPNQ